MVNIKPYFIEKVLGLKLEILALFISRILVPNSTHIQTQMKINNKIPIGPSPNDL
jgi:hypothetical protein